MSLNLHHIVRGAITCNYADEEFSLYRSAGQETERGIVRAWYRPPERVLGNFQSEGDAALDHADMAGKNTIIRRLYLYSPKSRKARPWSVYRPLARSGDYIETARGEFWMVLAVLEDFSDAGWECLRCQLQTTPVELCIRCDDCVVEEDDPDGD